VRAPLDPYEKEVADADEAMKRVTATFVTTRHSNSSATRFWDS